MAAVTHVMRFPAEIGAALVLIALAEALAVYLLLAINERLAALILIAGSVIAVALPSLV
jgi:hypothetical protein